MTTAENRTTIAKTSRRLADRAMYFSYAARAKAIRRFANVRLRGGRKKVVILDPGLIDYYGHHAEFAALLKSTLQSQYDVRIYANFRARVGLLMRMSAEPVFYDDLYPPGNGQHFDVVYGDMTRTLTAALTKVSTQDLSPSTHVIMHTATIFQLGSLADWYSALPEPRPKLIILFHRPLEYGVQPASQELGAIALAREAVAKLAAAGRIGLASFSRQLSDRISLQLGQFCSVVPLPVQWPDPRRIVLRPLSPTFGFFGGFRIEKGAALLADVIPIFAESHRDVRFIIHAPQRDVDASALERLSGVPGVEILRTTFAIKEEYFRQLMRAGCVLLPYHPPSYTMRASGVLPEALGLGRMVITTRGTWLEDQVRSWKGNAFLMDQFTPDSLLECLDRARNSLLANTIVPKVDQRLIATFSSAGFCDAVMSMA